MKYLLDTNVCIAVLRNRPAVLQRLAALSPDDCAISTVTSYELLTGVRKCADPAGEQLKVERLLGTVHQLPFDAAAAAEAAVIRAALETMGRPIGPYDTLLAGHAISAGIALVTHNTAEFSRVAGLLLEDWQAPEPN